MNWQEQLRSQGFARFPRLTPEPLIKAARDAIELDLNTNYDPERKTEYDNRSYCPDLKGTPPIMNLLEQSPVFGPVKKLESGPARQDAHLAANAGQAL